MEFMKKIFSILMAVIMIAMTVTSVAAAPDSFVPSIEAKDGPSIVLTVDSKGNDVAAIIYDKDGHEIIGVPEEFVIVTPMAGATLAIDIIKDALEYAQKQINDADNLGDLSDEIAEFLQKNYPDIDLNDLLVSQLFDVRLAGEYSKYLKDGAKFSVQLDFGESFLCFLMSQGNDWVLCKDYKADGNVVTLNLTGATQIALVKNNYSPSDLPSNKNEASVESPQTSDYTNFLFISLGVLFAAGAVLLMVMFVNDKHSKKEN